MNARAAVASELRPDTHAERMRIKLSLADTIVLDPTLSNLERRVALRLLSYLHFRTLKMWPGAERLAVELAADERNVRRALSSLCHDPKGDDEGGYFRKVPGTGRGPGNPTVYEARWDRAFEGARVAKGRLDASEQRVKTNTEAGKSAHFKAGQLAPRYLRKKTFDKTCLAETPAGGEGGVGGEGARACPPDASPEGGNCEAKAARQAEQADRPEPQSPPSARGFAEPKPTKNRWRASSPKPLGPGERMALAFQGRKAEPEP